MTSWLDSEKLRPFFNHFRKFLKFLGLAFLLLISWVVISTYLPEIIHTAHFSIIKPQADISAFFLRLLGHEFNQEYMVYGCEARLVFQEHGSICIGTGCSGLELFLVFFGFILLMKGDWKNKLWFVPMGFLGILILNIIRIITLCLFFIHAPQYVQFNHKYTFVIIVYVAIFGLWILWANKFANKKQSNSS